MLGILPGLVGVIQATETIKLILGAGDSLVGRLLLVDALAMRFRELKLQQEPRVPGMRRQSDCYRHSSTMTSSAGSVARKNRQLIISAT